MTDTAVSTREGLLYIGGELVAASETHEVVSPATGEVVGTVAWGGAAEAERALGAAKAAMSAWEALGIDGRAAHMSALRDAVIAAEDELRSAVVAETGKTWAHSEDDHRLLVDALAFYAEAVRDIVPVPLVDAAGTHTHELRRRPIGVAVAFTAWNFPLLNVAYKLGPAMAAGCPVVIKPSARTPLAASVLARLCAEVGLPAGAVNIIWGDDQAIGDALSSSTIPALVTLIGSTETGRHVMRTAATSIKRLSFELGGNAPAIVLPDADLDLAADIIGTLKFANAGQVCVTPNRILAHEDIADELTARLVARAQATRTGTGAAGSDDMGSLIAESAVDRVLALIEGAESSGARVLAGGGRPEGAPTRAYLEPTVVDGVEGAMALSREEIFGPVAAVQRFRDVDDAIARANDTDAGLSSFVFGSDPDTIARIVGELQFGEVQVNGVKYAIELPHGGMKQSGVGFDCSVLALDDYLVIQRVSTPVPTAGKEN
ncbi:aldehyde dehydrogenase family protein [Microbacterium aquimaris]|uniref:aldehyde dehydrogenase family protein n=1 Tax=Microbacterium aquimaris TaxID=459816 RepID=UPI002AD448B4|nr:aldehyde dehydrogenase family protein [Microbacterium aquimaris]MDZ8275274.1 aldehyde dehydrogenase family protein [Microbacterium aquimaris]